VSSFLRGAAFVLVYTMHVLWGAKCIEKYSILSVKIKSSKCPADAGSIYEKYPRVFYDARVARDIAHKVGACCFALLAECWNRPPGPPKSNPKSIFWTIIGIKTWSYFGCTLDLLIAVNQTCEMLGENVFNEIQWKLKIVYRGCKLFSKLHDVHN